MPAGTVIVAAAVDRVWLPSTWVTGGRNVWLASVLPPVAVAFWLKVSLVPEFTCVTTDPAAMFRTAV